MSGAGPRTTSSEPIVAIVNASVILMDTERVISDATVILRGDRIAWVGPTRDADVPSNADRVDARGALVVRGLADMHVTRTSAT